MAGVHAIERDEKIDVIYIKRPPDEPGIAYRIFSSLAIYGIDVDLILQTASQNRGCDIVFTVHKESSAEAEKVLNDELEIYPDTEVMVDRDIVKITISGDGMQGQPGVAAEVFRCLWSAGVRIINISTSEIKISMLVAESDGERAFVSLLESFEIEQ